jgi:hypothetical protein
MNMITTASSERFNISVPKFILPNLELGHILPPAQAKSRDRKRAIFRPASRPHEARLKNEREDTMLHANANKSYIKCPASRLDPSTGGIHHLHQAPPCNGGSSHPSPNNPPSTSISPPSPLTSLSNLAISSASNSFSKQLDPCVRKCI